jgi:membrane-associated phospholipid phosphatase
MSRNLAPKSLHSVPHLTRKRAVITLLAACIVAAAFVPLDRTLVKFLGPYQLDGVRGLGSIVGGDFKRELEFVQQFGAITSVVITGFCILLLDRAKGSRVFDLAIACIATALSQNAFKMLVGRPRPRVVFSPSAMPGYDSPTHFAFAWQSYPLPRADVEGGYLWAHPWELTKNISSDLWSMPSSHTAAAFCLAACLARLYPQLRPLVWTLACIVAFARIVLGAHFVSDVVMGGAMGLIVGAFVFQLELSKRVFRSEAQTPSSPRV